MSQIETMSSMGKFLSCERYYYWRYLHCLVTGHRSKPLEMGTWFHLGMKFINENLKRAQAGEPHTFDYEKFFNDLRDSEYQKYGFRDPLTRHCHAHAIGMIMAYLMKFPLDELMNERIIAPEHTFVVPIKYPEDYFRDPNDTWNYAGQCDLIVDSEGYIGIREYKTASDLDDRIMTYGFTMQNNLYVFAIERFLGIKIEFFEYDTIVKTNRTFQDEESEEDFQQRYLAACAKNKSGKSSITRNIGDTDESFLQAVMDSYREKARIDRRTLNIDRAMVGETVMEAMQIAGQIAHLHSEGDPREQYLKNDKYCLQFGSICQYAQLCAAGANYLSVMEGFDKGVPHPELTQSVLYGENESGPEAEEIDAPF